ncbi:hypothetical protein [Reyranella sp.]|uniref:hypothetical protein n=1 Tax=Reyranella sp. TaxID=1929291 RepID=UPI003D1133C9
MIPPGADAMVEAAAAKVLAEPLDRRIEAFAEAMQAVLDELAAQHPRSSARDLTRMAQQIGRRVLDRLRHPEASSEARR